MKLIKFEVWERTLKKFLLLPNEQGHVHYETRPTNVAQNKPGAPFSSHPESLSKISNLMFTGLFYSYNFNIVRGSCHARIFRSIHFSAFRCRFRTKNGFAGVKRFRGFRETGPRGQMLLRTRDVKALWYNSIARLPTLAPCP